MFYYDSIEPKKLKSYLSISGTLFEEIYVNSGDMSFLGAALIWSLMWKYGGLFVHQDTLLLLSLKSYYNFVVLNSAGELLK